MINLMLIVLLKLQPNKRLNIGKEGMREWGKEGMREFISSLPIFFGKKIFIWNELPKLNLTFAWSKLEFIQSLSFCVNKRITLNQWVNEMPLHALYFIAKAIQCLYYFQFTKKSMVFLIFYLKIEGFFKFFTLKFGINTKNICMIWISFASVSICAKTIQTFTLERWLFKK